MTDPIAAVIAKLRQLGADLNRGAAVPNLAEQIWDHCDQIEALVREADAIPAAPPVDLSNHHNALVCPYCNPKGLKFAHADGCAARSYLRAPSRWSCDCGAEGSGAAAPPAHETRFAWLMERRLDRDDPAMRRTPAGTLVYWDGGHAESFTTDPYKAVQWPTKEAAMQACPPEDYAQWGWRYVEHGFIGSGAAAPPEPRLLASEAGVLLQLSEDKKDQELARGGTSEAVGRQDLPQPASGDSSTSPSTLVERLRANGEFLNRRLLGGQYSIRRQTLRRFGTDMLEAADHIDDAQGIVKGLLDVVHGRVSPVESAQAGVLPAPAEPPEAERRTLSGGQVEIPELLVTQWVCGDCQLRNPLSVVFCQKCRAISSPHTIRSLRDLRSSLPAQAPRGDWQLVTRRPDAEPTTKG